MFRPRMIWELSFAFHSAPRLDVNDAGLHLTFHGYRLSPHRPTHYLLYPTTSHIISLSTRPINKHLLNPITETSLFFSIATSISISILQIHKTTTPRQTPSRTPTLARPLPRPRRVPRPMRAGPVRPRSMMISVVWRVGRSISVSRQALALVHSQFSQSA